MSDIVERLRETETDIYTPPEAANECREAAAEIERLRVERDEARKTMREWSENCGAEVQRLRGLLHECLSFALGAPIGRSSDLWERVTETLGSDVRKDQIR